MQLSIYKRFKKYFCLIKFYRRHERVRMTDSGFCP